MSRLKETHEVSATTTERTQRRLVQRYPLAAGLTPVAGGEHLSSTTAHLTTVVESETHIKSELVIIAASRDRRGMTLLERKALLERGVTELIFSLSCNSQ